MTSMSYGITLYQLRCGKTCELLGLCHTTMPILLASSIPIYNLFWRLDRVDTYYDLGSLDEEELWAP